MQHPQHGPDVSLAAAFGHPGVARAYRHRPPYPDEVFDVLQSLISDRPRTVLDIGAGEGALARPLARRADHVDALDISAAMVAEGRERPGGRVPNLRWIVGAAETAPLDGPYALVTAGASLQRTEDYIEQFHSTASLAREWMPPSEAASFGREVRAVVAPFATDGELETRIAARLTWGRILTGSVLP